MLEEGKVVQTQIKKKDATIANTSGAVKANYDTKGLVRTCIRDTKDVERGLARASGTIEIACVPGTLSPARDGERAPMS